MVLILTSGAGKSLAFAGVISTLWSFNDFYDAMMHYGLDSGLAALAGHFRARVECLDSFRRWARSNVLGDPESTQDVR